MKDKRVISPSHFLTPTTHTPSPRRPTAPNRSRPCCRRSPAPCHCCRRTQLRRRPAPPPCSLPLLPPPCSLPPHSVEPEALVQRRRLPASSLRRPRHCVACLGPALVQRRRCWPALPRVRPRDPFAPPSFLTIVLARRSSVDFPSKTTRPTETGATCPLATPEPLRHYRQFMPIGTETHLTMHDLAQNVCNKYLLIISGLFIFREEKCLKDVCVYVIKLLFHGLHVFLCY